MNKKISLLAISLLLTACGGGGGSGPVSTLPQITTPTQVNKLSIKTTTDNKAEIVAYVEGLGIDLTTTENIQDHSRHANSRKRNASSITTKTKTLSLDEKYEIAKQKYENAKSLLNKNIDEIRNAVEEDIINLLKFFFPDWWKNKADNETAKDIISNKHQNVFSFNNSSLGVVSISKSF